MSVSSLSQSPLPSLNPSKFSHSRTLSDESATSKKSDAEKSFLSQVQNASQLVSILKELKDDVVNGRAVSMDQDLASKRLDISQLSGSDNVYIEHNGKYTKAPKQMLDFDFLAKEKRDHFDQKKSNSKTPLDMAIWIQRSWSKLAYFCTGIMGGLSLFELILVLKLMPSDESNRKKFLQIYPYLETILTTMFFFCFNFSLVALLDWIDLGHLYVIRVGDKLQFKKVVAIIIFMFAAYILSLTNRSIEDSFILHDSSNSNFTIGLDGGEPPDLKQTLVNWEFLCLCKDSLLILAWFLLVVSKNEDLFLYHMLALKKYDFPTSLNEAAIIFKKEKTEGTNRGLQWNKQF